MSPSAMISVSGGRLFWSNFGMSIPRKLPYRGFPTLPQRLPISCTTRFSISQEAFFEKDADWPDPQKGDVT